MLKGVFYDSLKGVYKELYGKPLQRDWVARVVFSQTNPFNFRRRCNSYF